MSPFFLVCSIHVHYNNKLLKQLLLQRLSAILSTVQNSTKRLNDGWSWDILLSCKPSTYQCVHTINTQQKAVKHTPDLQTADSQSIHCTAAATVVFNRQLETLCQRQTLVCETAQSLPADVLYADTLSKGNTTEKKRRKDSAIPPPVKNRDENTFRRGSWQGQIHKILLLMYYIFILYVRLFV